MTRLTILGIGAVAIHSGPEAGTERHETVCRSCVRAHIESGYQKDEERIFCTLGGWMRTLEFPIRTCTSFEERSDTEVGFVLAVDEAETVLA